MTESGVIPRPEDRDPKLALKCDFCGAPPGQPCVNTVNRDCPMTIPHVSRTPQAVRRTVVNLPWRYEDEDVTAEALAAAEDGAALAEENQDAADG